MWPTPWAHCSGKENPADLVTRGLYAEELVSSPLWLVGPRFLVDSGCMESPDRTREGHEVSESQCHEVSMSKDQLGQPVMGLVTASGNQCPFLEVDRWSSLTKGIRVMGWILRFINNARGQKPRENAGDLSFTELSEAKTRLLQCVQQAVYGRELEALRQGQSVVRDSSIASPFLGTDGLLRVGGRVEHSHLTYDEKHPIIIPKGHFALLLVRFQHVLLKHAGVVMMIVSLRSQFWVVGLRRIAKKVRRGCVSCLRQDAQKCNQPMAPLPED